MNKLFAGMLIALVMLSVLAAPVGAVETVDVAQRSFAAEDMSIRFRVEAVLLDTDTEAQKFIDARVTDTEFFPFVLGFDDDVAFVDVAKPTAFGDYTRAIEATGLMYGLPGTAAVIYVRLGNVGLMGWVESNPDVNAYDELEALMRTFVPVTGPDGSVRKPADFVPEGTGAFRYLPTEHDVGMELMGEWIYQTVTP